MCILELISSGYELTKYLINQVVIQEKGILLGGSLTCEELVGVTWRMSDCEELVGGTYRR